MEESELIDKFLRGELDTEQDENLTKQIQANNELKRKVALRKLVIEGINLAYTEKLKQDLIEFDKTLDGKNRVQFSWKTAAVFAFFITASSIAYFVTRPTDPYNFDIAEPGIPNSMGAVNDIEFINAMNEFKAGDFVTSGQVFKTLLKTDHANDTLLYFSGLCDLRNREVKPAIEKFQQINVQSAFSIKATYRLAIAYWADGDTKKAIELLEKIKSDKNNPFSEQAEKALQAIN